MKQDEKRSKPNGRESSWGWKGLGKDPTYQTTLFVVLAAVNFFLMLYAFSELGEIDAKGMFRASGEMPVSFFVLTGVTIVSCGLTAPLIRYPDVATRWSARLFACGLPAAFLVLLWLNWHK